MKHTKNVPATPLRLLTADEIRQWPTMEGRYFLAVTDPEHAARLFNRDNAYPRLMTGLRVAVKCAQVWHTNDDRSPAYKWDLSDHPTLGPVVALLRELGEVE